MKKISQNLKNALRLQTLQPFLLFDEKGKLFTTVGVSKGCYFASNFFR